MMDQNNKIIPLSVPNLSVDILPLLEESIKTGWISTGGRFIAEFEQKVINYTGIKHAVALHSGTAGLHLSLKVLDLKQDEEVIVPTVTFIAAVNPVMYMGAKPVFMDCDDSLNMDLTKLEDFLDNQCDFTGKELINRTTKRVVRGIVIVHVFGNPIDMDRILRLKEKYKLFVVEDATEALGSFIEYPDGQKLHCGGIGDIGVLSFNANKIITTGGGGMVLSQNKEYIDRIRHLSTQAKTDSSFFVHDEIGFNYRISNLHAALGVNQMDYLDGFIENKIRNYKLYKSLLDEIPGLTLLPFNENTRANHWFYSVYVDESTYGISRDLLISELENQGILTRPIWDLIHRQKPYEPEMNFKIEKAYDYVEHIINLPCSTNLSTDDVHRVVNALKIAGKFGRK